MIKETETLDKLYLEWSQFTSARTSREIEMKKLLWEARDAFIEDYKPSKEWFERFFEVMKNEN